MRITIELEEVVVSFSSEEESFSHAGRLMGNALRAISDHLAGPRAAFKDGFWDVLEEHDLSYGTLFDGEEGK